MEKEHWLGSVAATPFTRKQSGQVSFFAHRPLDDY